MADNRVQYGQKEGDAVHILLVLPPNQPHTGGNITYSNRLKKGLAPYGIQIEIVCLDHLKPHHYEAANIVHVFNAFRTGRFVLPAVQALGKPMILTITGTDINEYMTKEETRKDTIPVVEYASRIIQLTDSCRQELVQMVPSTADKATVVNLGVDLPPVTPKNRADFGLREDEFIFLLPAGIRPVKNPLLACIPMQILHQHYPHVRFVIAGPMMDENLCEELKDWLGANEWMTYLGEVDYTEMPALMKCADVVLNTSKSEGLSHALLEAMSLGKPVLASRVVGNVDLIQDGFNGFLFSDTEDFVKKAVRYLEEEGLRNRLAATGQQWVQEHYSVDNEIRMFKQIYEDVMCRAYSMQTDQGFR